MDIDLEKFFDRVNHDMLMARVGRVVKDKRVLKLIRAYLNSGVMETMETMERIRHLTKRTRSGKLEDILSEINCYLRGWIAYFRRAATPSISQELDEWIRRRLRQLLWKRWKTGTTRYREWIQLGVPHEGAALGAIGTSPWRISRTPVINEALSNTFWRNSGLERITERYNHLCYSH